MFTSTRHDDLVTVQAGPRLEYQELDGCDNILAALLGDSGFAQIALLDLSNTLYLDSAGINWLLNCHRRFREAGGALVIHSITPMVMQVIRLMRLDRVFQLADDARSARLLLVGAALCTRQT